MRHISSFTLAALSAACAISAQQHLVVPSANALTDANRFCALAGAVDPFRHQILVGATHLAPLTGKTLQAIEFRRSASDETYLGGSVSLSVEMSASPHAPIDCSQDFASNAGGQPTQVFSGVVAVPTSPATTGPSVPWASDNVVRITFTTPFIYTGGPLCIDIVGYPVIGQTLDWWMADANFETVASATSQLGGGCGPYGDGNGRWSWIERNSLVAGGFAHMTASGTPYGLAVAAIGDGSTTGIPLHMIGFGQPSACAIHLSSIILLEPRLFLPEPAPFAAGAGGTAHVELKIPGIPAALGTQLTTQWLDFSGEWSSNAIEWTIAPSLPALDMALVEGHPTEAQGTATPLMAHVLRFEYQ